MANDMTLSARITANATEFDKQVKKAQASLQNLSSHAKGMGDGFVNIGKGVSNVGTKLTNYITKPAAAALASLTALTLVKGFNRLESIDTARTKLKALRMDAATVTQVMDDALKAVKGTAYGLDEAATTAASAVAAGIKPGQQLEKYLRTTADAAAVAGMSMEEMGAIFNKVSTKGKASTREIKQLAEKGIPIYQYLAKEIGVSTEKVAEMATKGQIDTATFLKAVENNIGNAALVMGTSFSGAVKNMGASLSRIGQGFLDGAGKGTGFFSQLKPLLVDFTMWLGNLEGKAAKIGEMVGTTIKPYIKAFQELRLTTAGIEITPDMSKMLNEGKSVTEILQEMTKNSANSKAEFDQLNSRVQESTNKLAINAGKWGLLAVAIGPVMKLTGGAIQGFGGITKAIGGLGSGIANLGGNFSTALVNIVANNNGIIGSLGSLTTAFSSAFSIATVAGIFLVGLGFLYAKFHEQIDQFLLTAQTKGPEIITRLSEGISLKLGEWTAKGAELITKFIETLTINLPAITTGATQIITTLVNGVSSALPTLIPTAMNAIITFAGSLTDNLPTIIDAGLNLIQSLVTGIENSIPMLLDNAPTLIFKFATAIISSLPKIISVGGKIIVSLISGIIQFWGRLPGVALETIGKFKEKFQSTNWGEVGSNIMKGIAKGIMSGVGLIVSAAKNAAKSAYESAKKFLNINSPSKLFKTEIGYQISAGEALGIESGGGLITKALTSTLADSVGDLQARADIIMSTAEPTATPTVPSFNGASGTYRVEGLQAGGFDGTVTVNNVVEVDGTPLKVKASRYTIDSINKAEQAYQRAKGAFAGAF